MRGGPTRNTREGPAMTPRHGRIVKAPGRTQEDSVNKERGAGRSVGKGGRAVAVRGGREGPFRAEETGFLFGLKKMF